MSQRKWQPVVVIGSGPRLVRVARALGGDVRCIDVHQLKDAYGAAVAAEVLSQVALASVGLRRPGERRLAPPRVAAQVPLSRSRCEHIGP